jgi:hypothetical protein
MASMSYGDFAKRFGNKDRATYENFRDAMDNHYNAIDQALKPAPLPVDPTSPNARGAMSPLGGQAIDTPAPVRIPVSMPQRARGGRVR